METGLYETKRSSESAHSTEIVFSRIGALLTELDCPVLPAKTTYIEKTTETFGAHYIGLCDCVPQMSDENCGDTYYLRL